MTLETVQPNIVSIHMLTYRVIASPDLFESVYSSLLQSTRLSYLRVQWQVRDET